MEFVISFQINLSEPSSATSGTFSGFLIGLYSFALTFLIMPYIFFKVFTQDISIINQEQFSNKYSGIL